MRLRVLAAKVGQQVRAALPGPRTVYVSERVGEYRAYWSEAAATLGATFRDIAPGIWEVRRGDNRTRLVNFITQCDDPVLLQLAGDKAFGYELARASGVPIPDHRVVTLGMVEEAAQFIRQVDGPVVVKPAAGSSSGLGVTTGVRTRRGLFSALALASLHGDRIIVERMVPGESYRILYLAGRPVHAVRRRGIRITGDGRRSVRELVAAAGHQAQLSDPMVPLTLATQGLSLTAVPQADKEVLARGLPGAAATRELRTVYDESVLDRCGPALLCEGLAVVRALGSELAGVDVITTDPAVSLRESGGAFIEINTTPGIHHHYVTEADRRSGAVAVEVLEHLLTRNGHAGAVAPRGPGEGET
jgi:cyanophycin synthetase